MKVLQKKGSRVLALILCLCMVLGLVPAVALAADVDKFTDVSPSAWYYEDADFVTRNGYYQGVSDTLFAPGATMTRAMLTTVLARYAEAQVDNSRSTFSDVPAGTWYTGAVSWANENGIVLGYGGGTFGPQNAITRQELAAVLCRFIGWYEQNKNAEHYTGGSTEPFPDAASIADWAKEDVAKCRVYGLFEGYQDGGFHPTDSSTRSQIAAVLHRLNWVKGGPIDKKDYQVTLYSEGKVYASATVKGGETYTMPQNPTRSGYSFRGWSLKEGGAVESAYKAGAQLTITGDLTLYAVWGGSGGGGSSQTRRSSTLTLDANYEGGQDKTVKAYERDGYTYTLQEADVPASRGADYYFAGWADAADAVKAQYQVGDSVDVTKDGKTIYAVWIYDYVGAAVKNTYDWANSDVETQVNKAAAAVVKFVNEKLAGDQKVAGSVTDELTLDVTYEDADQQKPGNGERTLNVTLNAGTNTESVLPFAEFAIRYLTGAFGGSGSPVTMEQLKADVKAMIQDLATELGYGDKLGEEVTQEALNQLVDELTRDYTWGFKENWLILGDTDDPAAKGQGASVVTHMKAVASTGGVFADVAIPGVTMDDVKEAVKQLLYAWKTDAADASQGKYLSELKLIEPVTVTFTPEGTIESAYLSKGGVFPEVYTINFNLNAGSNYLEYKFDGTESYVKVKVPEKVKTVYDEQIAPQIAGLLDKTTVQQELQKVIDERVNGLKTTLKDQANQLGSSLGLDSLGQSVDDSITAWITQNNLKAEGLRESFLYKRLLGNKEVYANNEQIDTLVGTVVTGVNTMLNQYGGEDGKTVTAPVQNVPLTLVLETNKPVGEVIKEAIASATPGQLSEKLSSAKDEIVNAIKDESDLTGDELWTAIGDAINGASDEVKELNGFSALQRAYQTGSAPTYGETAKQALISGVRKAMEDAITEAFGSIQKTLSKYESYSDGSADEENTLIQAVVDDLEAGLIVLKQGSVDTDVYKQALNEALCAYLEAQMEPYEGLVVAYAALSNDANLPAGSDKGLDYLWDKTLGQVLGVLKDENYKETISGLMGDEDWAKVAGFLTQVKNTLGDGAIGDTPIPFFQQLKNVKVKFGEGKAFEANALAGDLDSLISAANSQNYDGAVTALEGILNDYGLSELSLASFKDDGGVLITATYGDHELSFYLVLERDWQPNLGA